DQRQDSLRWKDLQVIALFDGECGICLGDIEEGIDEIKYDSVESEWVHLECLEERELDEDEFGRAYACRALCSGLARDHRLHLRHPRWGRRSRLCPGQELESCLPGTVQGPAPQRP